MAWINDLYREKVGLVHGVVRLSAAKAACVPHSLFDALFASLYDFMATAERR